MKPRKPATSGSFDRLPAELIYIIASWLPLSSSVALRLCNRTLNHTLGTQYLLALREHGKWHERTLFVRALKGDVLDALYCFKCNKIGLLLRKHESTLTPQERFKQVSEGPCLCHLTHHDWAVKAALHQFKIEIYHPHFNFDHVQMAMELHRRGLVSDAEAYIKCLSLVEPVPRKMASFPGNRGFYFLGSRIVDNKMFIRAQSWSLVPKEPERKYILPPMNRLEICSHLDAVPATRFYRHLRCKFAHLHKGETSCAKCQDALCCSDCFTETLVEAKCFGAGLKGNIVVVTKWQALGSGLSPYAIWRFSYSGGGFVREWPNDETKNIIRSTFENQPGIKYDSILDADKAFALLTQKSISRMINLIAKKLQWALAKARE